MLKVFSNITIRLQPHWFDSKIQSTPVVGKKYIRHNNTDVAGADKGTMSLFPKCKGIFFNDLNHVI